MAVCSEIHTKHTVGRDSAVGIAERSADRIVGGGGGIFPPRPFLPGGPPSPVGRMGAGSLRRG